MLSLDVCRSPDDTSTHHRFARWALCSAVAVILSPAASAAPWGLAPVPQVPYGDTTLSDCVVRATHTISLPGLFFGISDGDQSPDRPRSDYCAGMGTVADPTAWEPGTGLVILGGNSKTFIPKKAPQLRDVAIYGFEIDMFRISKMSDAVVPDPTLYPLSGVVEKDVRGITLPPNVQTGFTPDQFDPMPAFPVIAAAGANVNVPNRGEVTLAPGIYGDLTIGGAATVKLDGPGDFTFKSIHADNGCVFDPIHDENIETATNIYVEEFVHFGEFCDINPDDDPDDPNDDPDMPNKSVYFYIQGTDGSYGGANDSVDGLDGSGPAAFEYFGDRQFNACFVYTPNGTNNLRGVGDPRGYDVQFLGKHFQGLNLKVELYSPTKTQCPPLVPPVQCGAIGRLTIDPPNLPTQAGALHCLPNGELEVKGWALEIPLSVDTLEFYDINQPIPSTGQARNPCFTLTADADPTVSQLEAVPDPVAAIPAVESLLLTKTGGNFTQDLFNACSGLSSPTQAQVHAVLVAPLDPNTGVPVCYSNVTNYQIHSQAQALTCEVAAP